MAQLVNIDGMGCYLNYFVAVDYNVLFGSFYEKSLIKMKSCGARMGHGSLVYRYSRRYATKNEEGWYVTYAKTGLGKGRDHFVSMQAISKSINKEYLVTKNELLEEDFYNFLMGNFKLPLLKKWTGKLIGALLDENLINHCYTDIYSDGSDEDITITLHGKDVKLRSIVVYKVSGITNELLSQVVSDLLSENQISIVDNSNEAMEIMPLNFKGFDDYVQQYGSSLVEKLEEEIHPLVPLKGTVDGLAFKHKRLYPQQAACVNGIIALRNHGIHYGIMNEGMGVGKVRRYGVVWKCAL